MNIAVVVILLSGFYVFGVTAFWTAQQLDCRATPRCGPFRHLIFAAWWPYIMWSVLSRGHNR